MVRSCIVHLGKFIMKKFPVIAILVLRNLSLAIPQDCEFQHEIFQPEGISYDYPTCLMQDSRDTMVTVFSPITMTIWILLPFLIIIYCRWLRTCAAISG